MKKNKKSTQQICNQCRKPNAYLGALSGTCPACQNKNVAEMERMLGMTAGTMGRVNSRGEEQEVD